MHKYTWTRAQSSGSKDSPTPLSLMEQGSPRYFGPWSQWDQNMTFRPCGHFKKLELNSCRKINHFEVINLVACGTCPVLGNHHLYLAPKYFRFSTVKPFIHKQWTSFSSPQPLATTNLHAVSMDLPISVNSTHINGIMQYVIFCLWFFSFT